MTQLLLNTRLTDRFFAKRAESAIAPVPFFGFGQIAWGTGYTEMKDGQPSVLAVLPDVVPTIIGEFARTPATYSYDTATKEIRVQAVIPKGILPSNVSAMWSACNVLDLQGGVIGLAVTLPTPVHSNVGVGVSFVLDTARPSL